MAKKQGFGVKPRLLIFSNLYPLPWEPQRGMFNCQQFSRLTEYFDVRIVVPVSFLDWYANKRHTLSLNDNYQGPERWLFPYFFTPKIFRNLYPLMMKWSVRLQLLSRIKKFKPHYILGSWLYPDGVVASDIATKLSIPYILKAHGSDINVYLDHSRRGDAILTACQNARKIIVVSRALKDILVSRGLSSGQVEVLYNGVDATQFYPPVIGQQSSAAISRSKKILFVGNLKRDKGVIELLNAISTMDREACHLTIVGDGVMRREMESFVHDHKLSGLVHFLGALPHDQLPIHMRESDLLVLPSYREGVPNVLLEAMACGLPVVATRVGGIPEVVEEGVNGFLVDVNDGIGLKNAIVKALSYPWDTGTISSKAKTFSWADNLYRLRNCIRGSNSIR